MSQSTVLILQVSVSAIVALVVVALGHALTLRRERQNRRQEQRITYLISVYRALSKANHHPQLYLISEVLEQAVADVQLFGTSDQIELTQKLALDLAKNQTADLDDLLIELRDSLRKELGAEPVSRRQIWLKITRHQDSQDAS